MINEQAIEKAIRAELKESGVRIGAQTFEDAIARAIIAAIKAYHAQTADSDQRLAHRE